MFCYIHKAAHLCKQKCDGFVIEFSENKTQSYINMILS